MERPPLRAGVVGGPLGTATVTSDNGGTMTLTIVLGHLVTEHEGAAAVRSNQFVTCGTGPLPS